MRISKKLAAVAAVAGVSAGLAGSAFAAWSSTGSGSALAKTTHDTPSVITAGVAAPDLYPGAIKSVTVNVSNPNPYAVIVPSIAAGSSPLMNISCAAGSVTSDARTDVAGLLQSDNTTTKIAAG